MFASGIIIPNVFQPQVLPRQANLPLFTVHPAIVGPQALQSKVIASVMLAKNVALNRLIACLG
jgi:hypothetical protein